MNFNFLKLSFLSIGALMASLHASNAQQNCAPRELVIDRLASAYGETLRSIGLSQGNTVVEVFASTETGSWTITITNAEGTSCLVASGQAFETFALTEPSKDDA